MKAAVLTQFGVSPVHDDFADPIQQNDEQILLNVKAASVKNIDKLRAGGKHPASHKELPAIVGLDGVGVLENGKRVYAQGITGMIAEKALIANNRFTILPDHIDNIVAAALPNAAFGSAMAILLRGKMQKGNTVLINGATGVTGRVAVQVAKHYGAAKIIATGRNAEALEKLIQLGADHAVSLKQDDESIIKQLKEINADTPIDLVIDYLWGHPTELIIKSFLGEGISAFNHPVRIVTVGDMAGESINLLSVLLRSAPVEILGSGLGSFSQNDLKTFNSQILPELFQLAADKKLIIETQVENLADIEAVWNKKIEDGKRLVISMD